MHKYTKEWKGRSLEELRREVAANKSQQFNNRFQYSTGKLENFHRLQQTRKELAVLLTLIREKELAQAGGGKG